MTVHSRLVLALRALGRWGRDAWMWFYRFTFGEDVFISYARLDGQRYALGLQSRLNRVVSVLMDQYVGEPGNETPARIKKGLKYCRQLVVVATPAALSSKNVDEEIRLFPRRSRAVQVIAFGAPIESARWFDTIPGLSKHTEDSANIESGHPSAEIVETICNSVGYWRQRRRNKLQGAFALVVTVLGAAGLVWVSRLADRIQQQAQQLEQGAKELQTAEAERGAVRAERDAAEKERDGARREAGARRELSGIEARRKQNGYVPPDELPRVLGAARTLEAAKLDHEAVAALSAVVDTMPHLVKRWKIPDGVSTHAVLPGDTLMLVSDGGAVLQSWNYLNGTRGRLRLQHREAVKSWVVEDAGRFIVSFAGRSVYVWRLPGGELVLQSDCSGCANPRVSPNGRYLAISRSANIGLFDLESKSERPSIDLRASGSSSQNPASVRPFFGTSDDVVFATVTDSGNASRVEAYQLTGTSIDAATLLPLNCLAPRAWRIEAHASGKLLVSYHGESYAGRLRVCSLAQGKATDIGPHAYPHVTANKDGTELLVREGTSASTGRVILWNTFSGVRIGSVPDGHNELQSFSGDGRFFSSAPFSLPYEAGIKEEPVWVAAAYDGRLRCLVPRKHPWEFNRLSDDGRYVVLGAKQSSGLDHRVHDFETWECEPHARLSGLVHGVGTLGSLEFDSNGAVSIVYYGFDPTPFLLPRTWQARMNPDSIGTRFTIARADSAPSNSEPRSIRLYTTRPPGPYKELEVHLSHGNLRYTGLGWLVVNGENESIIVRAIDPAREILRWPVPAGAGREYRFLRRARFVWKSVNNVESVFDLARRQEFRVPRGTAHWYEQSTDLAEAREGYRLASVEPQSGPNADFLVRVRDLNTSKEIMPPVRTAVEPVIALSDNGRLLLVSTDSRLSVWDLDSQRQVADVPESDPVGQVGFGPGDRWIWHDTGQQVRIRLWRLHDLVQLACDLVRRNQGSPNWPAPPADLACAMPS